MPSTPPWVLQGNGLGRDLCQALQSLTLLKINTVHFTTLFRKRYIFFLVTLNHFASHTEFKLF